MVGIIYPPNKVPSSTIYPSGKGPSSRAGSKTGASEDRGGAHGTARSYKTISKTSEVENGLFARSTTPTASEILPQKAPSLLDQRHFKPCLRVQADLQEIKDHMRITGKRKKEEGFKSHSSSAGVAMTPEDTDTVIISKVDMEKIKERSIILTDAEKEKIKKQKQSERDRIHAVANQRKQMMLKMEAERKRKSGRLTDAEILRRQNDDRVKAEAVRTMEENLDDSKMMNRMMLYARCVTIRDGQLHEKIDREREEEEDKMRWHHIMEGSRIQKIQENDQREALKKKHRYEGAEVIRKQIAERESDRKIAEEVKEQEGKKIRRESERMLKEDSDKATAKRIAGRKLLLEILKANDDAAEARVKAKEYEIEEEERRQVYVHEKEKRELAYLEAQEKIRKDKEMETIRLRSLQERAQDKQAVVDGLRALRIQEEHEREWREKERAEAERIQLMHEDLAKAREEQKIFKLKLLADQAREEQVAYYRVAVGQKRALIEARRRAEAYHAENIKNKEAVLAQIKQKADQRARELREKYEEGERLRQQIRVEKLRLENIKDRKLKILQNEGVPPKYRVELAKHKIVIH